MSNYVDFINNNKDKVFIKIKHVIDNRTLQSSFYRVSNVMCDGSSYYISSESVSVAFKNKKNYVNSYRK